MTTPEELHDEWLVAPLTEPEPAQKVVIRLQDLSHLVGGTRAWHAFRAKDNSRMFLMGATAEDCKKRVLGYYPDAVVEIEPARTSV